MLTQVDITNYLNNILPLPLMDSSAGYVVKEIDGLDPVTATLTSSSMAQFDGAQFQNAQRGTRNITMKLGLEPDYISNSVKSLRDVLYDYFSPKANIKLGFYIDDTLSFITTGQVESFENDMFSSDPEVDISVICYDPDFYDPASQTVSANSVADSSSNAFSYPGTSDTGVIFTLSVGRTITTFKIRNTTPDNVTSVFEVNGNFVAGDVIVVNTIPGSRSATLTRAGVTTSVLYGVPATSEWLTLKKGTNFFNTQIDGAGIPYTLVYTPKYGAI